MTTNGRSDSSITPSEQAAPLMTGAAAVFPSLRLTHANRDIVEKVAVLSRERFAQRAAEHDTESTFPIENYEDLRQAGLLAMTAPEKYGGLGLDAITYTLCLLEIARGCSATALTFNMHSTVLTLIAAMGNDNQQQRYFDEVVVGGKLIASVTSEPESSFRDRAVLRTSFVPIEVGYRVKGVKHFCSLGDSADYYFISGMLEGHTTAREGMLSALVPRDGNIEVLGRWNATGMRGTTSHTISYDAVIGPSEVLGRPGKFVEVDLSGFSLGYATTYLGVAEAAFDFILEYAKTKTLTPSTEPMSHNQLTQRIIGEMATAIQASKLLLCEAALAKERGDRQATLVAISQAKYSCAETGVRVTEAAMRLAGGSGFLKDKPLERWHRDSLAGPVMPPSDDRCLETIGKVLCGLRAASLEFQ